MPRRLLTPYSYLLSPPAFVDVSRVDCLGVTGVLFYNSDSSFTDGCMGRVDEKKKQHVLSQKKTALCVIFRSADECIKC